MQNPYQPPGNGPPPPAGGYGGYGYPQQQPFGAPYVPFGAASPHVTPEQAEAGRRLFAEREISDYAMWSLINGITSIFICGCFTGPIAIYRGHKALSLIAQHGCGHQHEGKAKVGRALGFVAVALWVLGIVGYFGMLLTR